MNRPNIMTALVLASLLALAGCTGGSAETADGSAPASTASSSAAATSPDASTPAGGTAASEEGIYGEHNDADAMFAQMMIPHHEQAVAMSRTLLDKDDVPEEVRELAEDVIAAQGPEVERMQHMLRTWAESSSPQHGGMDHGSADAVPGMHGMMSEEETSALEQARGLEAARLYLQQMTVHHQGAIEMARGELANGTNPEAVELAEDVVAAQETEIAEMEELLRKLQSRS